MAVGTVGLQVARCYLAAFFTVEMADGEKHRTGVVVEYADTTTIFTKPRDERTEDYVTGKFG